MSMSDSDSGDYKPFRQITRERLLSEMLRSSKMNDSKSTWKVLIMDKVTVKVMSYACKMADITDGGVSLVEDLYKRRQPLSMDAIYFIQPTQENVERFVDDMSGKSPLYRKAFVFFSSSVSKELVAYIKKEPSVVARISALSETNLEYFAIESQAFITDHEKALEELFGENAEGSHNPNDCLDTMATRISTVLASMKEFPYVRYRAAKSSLDISTLTTLHDLVPTKLAAGIWNCLAKYKTSIPGFPQRETCELLIVDRSVDQIAPIIHEWTYDAMFHDLLKMDGNKYTQEVKVPGKTGSTTEKKEVILEENDPIWLEIRDIHIADASIRLHDKMTNFVSKNKAAQMQNTRDGGELSTRDLQKMVQALPQYSEKMEKLSLHVEIAGKVNNIISEQKLKDVGKLEQDLIFGNAGTKELIDFLTTEEDITSENKLRLLLIYASIFPDKVEGDKGSTLMQLAELSPDDMVAVYNMCQLGGGGGGEEEGGSDTKKTSRSGFTSLIKASSNQNQKKHAARKERPSEEGWLLSGFFPIIGELIEKLNKGDLSKDEYPCMNDPCPTYPGYTSNATLTQSYSSSVHSVRSRPTAKARSADDGNSSDSALRPSASDAKRMGQRIFIFIIGGATRSELRVVHQLSTSLNREIILGSSCIDDPAQFITKLKMLSPQEVSL